jgi:hypothetical protein
MTILPLGVCGAFAWQNVPGFALRPEERTRKASFAVEVHERSTADRSIGSAGNVGTHAWTWPSSVARRALGSHTGSIVSALNAAKEVL